MIAGASGRAFFVRRHENIGIYSVSWLCPFLDVKNAGVKLSGNYLQLLRAREEYIGICSVFARFYVTASSGAISEKRKASLFTVFCACRMCWLIFFGTVEWLGLELKVQVEGLGLALFFSPGNVSCSTSLSSMLQKEAKTL